MTHHHDKPKKHGGYESYQTTVVSNPLPNSGYNSTISQGYNAQPPMTQTSAAFFNNQSHHDRHHDKHHDKHNDDLCAPCLPCIHL